MSERPSDQFCHAGGRETFSQKMKLCSAAAAKPEAPSRLLLSSQNCYLFVMLYRWLGGNGKREKSDMFDLPFPLFVCGGNYYLERNQPRHCYAVHCSSLQMCQLFFLKVDIKCYHLGTRVPKAASDHLWRGEDRDEEALMMMMAASAGRSRRRLLLTGGGGRGRAWAAGNIHPEDIAKTSSSSRGKFTQVQQMASSLYKEGDLTYSRTLQRMSKESSSNPFPHHSPDRPAPSPSLQRRCQSEVHGRDPLLMEARGGGGGVMPRYLLTKTAAAAHMGS